MIQYLRRNSLAGLRVVEFRGDVAASVAGRMLAALGADVTRLRLPGAEVSEADLALDLGKRVISGEDRAVVGDADVVLVAGDYADLAGEGLLPERLRAAAGNAILGYATPFGLTGPRREWRGGELVGFHASGMARLLIGPVPDLEAFPPVKAYGDQAAFVGGMTLAAAVMTTLAGGLGPHLVEISMQEALASIAVHELARPEVGERLTSRLGEATRGNATVMVLPAADGVVAVSPREPAQWDRWTEMRGKPRWALEPGMRDVRERQRRYDQIYPWLADFTLARTCADLYREAQQRHVPCFPLQPPGSLLDDPGLVARGFFTTTSDGGGTDILVPASPFGPLEDGPAANGARSEPAKKAPLQGVRVLDLSWVIAGPTCTRFLAAMGAEVIKIEAPERPDPARASVLHAVLGQGKRSVAVDLKTPEGRDIALRLAGECDVVVENFAAGVMERFGLGWEDLAKVNPRLIYLSLSGMGRNSPDAEMVAYGTLLQAYSGFSVLNGYPDRPPSIGWAWTDPVCALVMTAAIGAALHDREATGQGCRVDNSMVETMLWTLSGAIVHQQRAGEPPSRIGNAHPRFFPHGVYRSAGDDRWLAIAVRDESHWKALCGAVPGLAEYARCDLHERRAVQDTIDASIGAWARERDPQEAAVMLQQRGVPAAASADAPTLLADEHLAERRFFPSSYAGEQPARLAAIPWLIDGQRGRPLEPATALGNDTAAVLHELLGWDGPAVAELMARGVVA